MAQLTTKNGTLDIRFNEDRTRALATLTPPGMGGRPIEVADVLDRLKSLSVMYGIREKDILEAVHHVKETNKPLTDALVAQGTLPQDGTDGRIQYHLPLDLLSKPVPKDQSGQPDWFALDRGKMVQAEQEIATIMPPLMGIPGKTLTWPIETLAPRPGKPVVLKNGDNVRVVGGTRVLASVEGYACLHNGPLTVHALQCIETPTTGGIHTFAHGAVYLAALTQADIRADGFIAVKGEARHCFLRAHGDITVRVARDCTLIATGSVYVQEEMSNCQVITPNKLIALPHSRIIGGSLCAREGVEAGSLGAEDFTATEVIVGEDRYSAARDEEIKEELRACDANKERISQALKPFASFAAHTSLTDDKRALLQKMQEQMRALEERSGALHGERRALALSGKNRTPGRVCVAHTAHPGVWIHIGSAALQVEAPTRQVEFAAVPGGKSIETRTLAKAA